MSSDAFDATFTRHALASYGKQLRLADLLEEAGPWDLDLNAGTLTFENGPTFPIGLLGSWGEGAGSWLWVWGNDGMSGLPGEVTATAEAMRTFGEAQRIDEFSRAETEAADETFCHRLAMIAVGESGAGAYYRAPYQGGAAYLTIREALPPDEERHRLARVQRVIAEAISTFEMPHRAAIEAYAGTEGLTLRETEESEVMLSAAGGEMRIRFDGEGRIAEMKALLEGKREKKGGWFSRLFGGRE